MQWWLYKPTCDIELYTQLYQCQLRSFDIIIVLEITFGGNWVKDTQDLSQLSLPLPVNQLFQIKNFVEKSTVTVVGHASVVDQTG